MHHKKSSAFTIVELLIVIVVIAILASISMVAYTGVQRRAESTRAGVVAQQYRQMLTGYLAVHGEYPGAAPASSTGGWYFACLGTGYEVRNSTGRPACRWGNSPVYTVDAFNERLNSFAESSNDASWLKQVYWRDSGSGLETWAQGIHFASVHRNSHNAYTVDGEAVENLLIYFLPFDDGCTETLTAVADDRPYYELKRDPTAREARPV